MQRIFDEIVESEVVEDKGESEKSYIDILEDEIDYELEFDTDTLQIIDKDYEVEILDTLKLETDSLDIINENIVDDKIE